MELTLKQRLERVISKIENEANDKWDNAQGQEQLMHHHLIGWSSGGRSAIAVIEAEFYDILECEHFEPLSDEPVEPFYYIDNNNILFRDAYGRYFFWDENYFKAHGPYGGGVKACQAMRDYARLLDNETILESLGYEPKSHGGMTGEEE